MSGECESCGEHCLDCKCLKKYFTPEANETFRKWKTEVLMNAHSKIPECNPNFEEVSKFMRINVDILKQEITDHIDNELKRFNDELLRHR